MAQYISFFFAYEKKKNPSKTCCFTTGFELEKNEEKKRGGTEKIQYPPLRFRKIRTFKEIQVYTMSGKCLKYIQKKFVVSKTLFAHIHVLVCGTREL